MISYLKNQQAKEVQEQSGNNIGKEFGKELKKIKFLLKIKTKETP